MSGTVARYDCLRCSMPNSEGFRHTCALAMETRKGQDAVERLGGDSHDSAAIAQTPPDKSL